MGHFFKTQPNPKFLDPTQPKKVFTRPNSTQPIIDTWYGILGYTENFIQQLFQGCQISRIFRELPYFGPYLPSPGQKTKFPVFDEA